MRTIFRFSRPLRPGPHRHQLSDRAGQFDREESSAPGVAAARSRIKSPRPGAELDLERCRTIEQQTADRSRRIAPRAFDQHPRRRRYLIVAPDARSLAQS
jgi:hypothetical protein